MPRKRTLCIIEARHRRCQEIGFPVASLRVPLYSSHSLPVLGRQFIAGDPLFYRQLSNLFPQGGRRPAIGVYSACTANPWAIDAVLRYAASTIEGTALIEATANQIHPGGGYAAMTVDGFVGRIRRQAEAVGLAPDRVVMGGDHIGPMPWGHLGSDAAMEHACGFIGRCVAAGLVKLHVDSSTACLGWQRPCPGFLKTSAGDPSP